MAEVVHVRILVTIIATFVAIDFAILSYIFNTYSSILLTTEVILLPAIYIIGNYFAEYLLESRYNEDLNRLYDYSYKLNEKYIKLKYGKEK